MPAASSLTRARRSISDERSMPIACEARGPNSSIIRPVPVPMSTRRPSGVAKRPVDGALHLAFRDMKRTDLIPHPGVPGEVAGGRFGAVGADRLGPRGVGREQRAGGCVGPLVDQREQWLELIAVGKRQEHPAAFLAALEHAGVGKDLQVARDPRLALAENVRQLADRKLHDPQQREHPQPRRVGKRLEAVGEREKGSHGIRI